MNSPTQLETYKYLFLCKYAFSKKTCVVKKCVVTLQQI